MNKFLFLLFSVLSVNNLHSQNETNHWYFGTYAYLDFSTGSPVAGMGPLTTTEGTASISDGSGNLLFYTNGVDVWDSSHTIMPNGNGLMGDVSTTQSAIIVPSPVANTQFYIFTIDADGGADGFRYSIVDMTLNSGKGDVTASKNILLTDSVTEKVAAIKGIGGDNYWIVTHKWGNNQFYAYHLTTAGIQPPVISSVGTVHSTSTFQNTYGQMKFNRCGDRLALALGYMDLIELYDFNQNNGVVSNPLSLNLGDNVYGVEFSPDGNLLYTTCYDVNVTLAQFNITLATAPLILASKVPLSLTSDLYGLQSGPDEKIYVSRSFTSSYLGVINSPDVVGAGCGYNDNGVDLDPGFNGVNGALSLPAFVQSFFGAGDSCTNFSAISQTNYINDRVYPNPSNAGFTFEPDKNTMPAQLYIHDICGREISSFSAVSNPIYIGNNYPSGIYMLTILRGPERKTIKLVRQQ